jgi:hypothetical protein
MNPEQNPKPHHTRILFAVKEDDDLFHHPFPAKGQVRLCSRKEPTQVKITVSEEGEYWGWDDGKRISMIYPSLKLLKACFGSGIDVAEARGGGHRVRLKIEEYIQPDEKPEEPLGPSP